MSKRTVKALEMLSRRIQNKQHEDPLFAKDMSVEDRLLLYQPWIAKKLSIAELKRIIISLYMIQDFDDDIDRKNRLEVASIVTFAKSKKINEVPLVVLKARTEEKEHKGLVTEVREMKRTLRTLNKEIKNAEAQQRSSFK